MAVKIRLMRIGAKKRPFYRVVAVDERKKRTGQYLESLGTYNPLTEPKEIILKQDKIDEWVKRGAILSDGYLKITKKAPQKPPRKPKKEKEAKPETEAIAKTEETPAEEVVENVPAEETTAASDTSDGGSVNEVKTDSSEVSMAEEAVTEETTEPKVPEEK